MTIPFTASRKAVCEHLQLSPRTLKYWTERLLPASDRDGYTADEVALLEQAARLARAGFSLQAIHELHAVDPTLIDAVCAHLQTRESR